MVQHPCECENGDKFLPFKKVSHWPCFCFSHAFLSMHIFASFSLPYNGIHLLSYFLFFAFSDVLDTWCWHLCMWYTWPVPQTRPESVSCFGDVCLCIRHGAIADITTYRRRKRVWEFVTHPHSWGERTQVEKKCTCDNLEPKFWPTVSLASTRIFLVHNCMTFSVLQLRTERLAARQLHTCARWQLKRLCGLTLTWTRRRHQHPRGHQQKERGGHLAAHCRLFFF